MRHDTVITNMYSDVDGGVMPGQPAANVQASNQASYLVQFQRSRMEQLFRRQQSDRQPLRMMALEEAAQHMTVRLQSVSPEIVAHQKARRPQLLLDKG